MSETLEPALSGQARSAGGAANAPLVQEKIKQPLAEELLFGKLVDGGEVKVRLKDGQPAFEITPAPPKAARVKPAAKAKPARKTVKGDASNA